MSATADGDAARKAVGKMIVAGPFDLLDMLRESRKSNRELLELVEKMRYAYPDVGNILASLRNVDRSLLAALQILQGRK